MKKLFCLFSLVCVGCSVGPSYEPPEVEMPKQWNNNPSPQINCELAASFAWWESFNDPELNSLIERAGQQNLDLRIVEARILEAREEEKAGSSALYPHIDGSLTYGHAQYDQKSLRHALGIGKGRSKSKNINLFEGGFDALWEIDLFGKTSHQQNALQARAESVEEEYGHLWVSLSAEVARNYIELRGLQRRLELLNQHIFTQKEALRLTQGLSETGFVSRLEQRQAEEQLYNLEAQRPDFKVAIKKTIHRLSILLNYEPGALYCELESFSNLPFLPPLQPMGLPCELLRRRPDIRKAEREYAASIEDVGSAVADQYPRFSLQGFIGDFTTTGPGRFTWYGGSQILAPIFNSQLLEQDVTVHKLRAKQALYAYQKTVLEALEETENALASFQYEQERSFSLSKSQASSRGTLKEMQQLYHRGFKSYLDVQAANRALLTAEDAYLQTQIALLLDYISIYKALGGAWNQGCVHR